MAAASGAQNPDIADAATAVVPVRAEARDAARLAEVERQLRESPFEFDFFYAVRLLEQLQPERVPVGGYSPAQEAARFGAHASMSFPASAIQRLDWEHSGPPAVIVNFMGLTGPLGLLPIYYTELLLERMRAKDTAMMAFFDMFNHRMISLFYRAWEKYRFGIAYERGERDRVSSYLGSFIGMATPGLWKRQRVLDESLLFYTGLLSLHTRSAEALRSILIDYFDVPVEVEQFVGAWYRIEHSALCIFDKGNSYSEQLGVGAVVGDEIWNQQPGVRVRLGPLTIGRYVEFLPDGAAYPALRAMLRFFGGDEIDFQVQLALKREDVPRCRLGEESAIAPRLGWVSWAKTIEMRRDPHDTILNL